MRHQTLETLRASQSERDTSVSCCLYLSEDSNALDYISEGGGGGGGGGGEGGEGGGGVAGVVVLGQQKNTILFFSER